MFRPKIIIPIIFYLLLNIQPTYSNEIVFIDVDLLFSQSKQGKIIISNLNDANKKNQDKLIIKEEEIINLKTQIENQKNFLKKEELDKKINDFNNLVNNFNELKSNLQKNYQDVKNEEIKKFFNIITPLLEKYMVDKSIKIIFDRKNIFLADNEFDVTSDIIKIIDKNF